MIDLYSADAYQNAQNFQAGSFEGQDRIQARSALLNVSEVNARYVGNRLDSRLRVAIVQGYGRLVDYIEELGIRGRPSRDSAYCGSGNTSSCPP